MLLIILCVTSDITEEDYLLLSKLFNTVDYSINFKKRGYESYFLKKGNREA